MLKMSNMQKSNQHSVGSFLLRTAIGVAVAVELFALGVLAYLGSFTRYRADDYCEISILGKGPALLAIYRNYMSGEYRAANRFSNLLFVDWSEALGKYNVQFLPTIMILVWIVGLIWLIYQVFKLIGIHISLLTAILLSTSIVFFSAIQAPNRFQTFFWRSSVATHFAPLVFMPLMMGFILFQVRSAKSRPPALWVSLIVCAVSFLLGGFSEPATAFMFVVYVFSLLYVWWNGGSEQQTALRLLASGLFGTFLALCVLFFAPGNLLHGKTSLSILPGAVMESFWFAFKFVRGTLLTLPLPTLISVLIPGLLFFCLYINPDNRPFHPEQKRRIKTLLILVPLLHFLLIAASFAPSAYGQAYPAERARFLGRFLMTALLIFEGALLGMWFAQFKGFAPRRDLVFPIAGFTLLILGFYPLRAGFTILNQVDGYKSWASAWDARDAYIKKSVAEGVRELVVVQLDSIGDVLEYKADPISWVNVCAAEYYGLNSLVAP